MSKPQHPVCYSRAGGNPAAARCTRGTKLDSRLRGNDGSLDFRLHQQQSRRWPGAERMPAVRSRNDFALSW